MYHSESSVRELHPFTTTTHLASQNLITHYDEDDIEVQFLFRKRGASVRSALLKSRLGFAQSFFGFVGKVKNRKQHLQWTDKLASLTIQNETAMGTDARSNATRPVAISLRLEGPYFTTADPSRYKTVVCIVAGTGVSGAIAISGAFKELERQCGRVTDSGECNGNSNCAMDASMAAAECSDNSGATISQKNRRWRRCIVIWSVRQETIIDLPELKSKFPIPILRISNSIITGLPSSGYETQIHLTGEGRKRLSVGDTLDNIVREETANSSDPASIWVYLSGPNAFIEAGEAACKERHAKGVDWYGARWDI